MSAIGGFTLTNQIQPPPTVEVTVLNPQALLLSIVLLLVWAVGRRVRLSRNVVKEIVEVQVTPVEPAPCLPKLEPVPSLSFVGATRTVVTANQVDIQAALDDASVRTVFLNFETAPLASPLTITRSIKVVGIGLGTRLLLGAVNQQCFTVTGANVEFENVSMVNPDTGDDSSCVLVQGAAQQCVFKNCKFSASRQAIRIATEAQVYATGCSFAPTSDTQALDYFEFTGGKGASTIENCVFTPKMDGATGTPYSRLVVRKTGTFENFSLQLVGCSVNGDPNSVLLAGYVVQSEATTTAQTEKTQQVSIWNCNLGYVAQGAMFFEGAEVTMGKYKWLTLYNTVVGFQRPLGNITLLQQGLICFTKPNVGTVPGAWPQAKPIIYAGGTQIFLSQQDDNYVAVNGTGSRAFSRNELFLEAANPPFQIEQFGGC